MKSAKGSYLVLQWNTYSARLEIPKDLRKVFQKREFKQSLDTSDLSEAAKT